MLPSKSKPAFGISHNVSEGRKVISNLIWTDKRTRAAKQRATHALWGQEPSSSSKHRLGELFRGDVQVGTGSRGLAHLPRASVFSILPQFR